MATIIVTSILTSGFIIMCLLFFALEHKRRQKKLNTLLLQFSKAGSENDLIFSGQEILAHNIIGLDGIKRKLLVFSKKIPNHYLIIDLLQVAKCSVQKKYNASKQSGTVFLTRKKELNGIVLQFEFIDRRTPLDILFHSSEIYWPDSVEEIKRKAMDWEVMLSKLIRTNSKKTA